MTKLKSWPLDKMYKAIDIAKWLDGIVEGEPSTEVNGIALIDDATSTDLTYIRKQSDLQKIESTKAGVILVPPILSLPRGKTYIKVPCLPEEMLPMLLRKFQQKAKTTSNISPQSVIGQDVLIGEQTTIYPNVVIADGVTIGAHCIIYPNVVIGEGVTIGSGVIIHPGAIIGSDSFEFIKIGQTYEKLVNVGNVIIGNHVEIGANTTIDKGTIGTTMVGDGTKIDNLVQIAHEVKIGENCIIAAQVGIAGWAKIGNFTTIYGQCGIVGDIEIGDHVVVMAKSIVTKNIKNNQIISGNPAVLHSENLKFQAQMKRKIRDKENH
ncbi:UDP-3-O-(3-hydroxymyristoyl)glucosamine N-acyltransferase [Lysinibacillus sp. BW-2-10]|uniref:UDP-3-O-(3-hydroxymyristoyl)glucosamine N-acyltransferase n=1 Tax=Lysinibacillus sp. BW-2-10 TaxID=2590030 RepID=UPI00117D5EA2|nr:UDP-3-O-(3-hydroxymyristoyl)glucosamine N-acyltransferase [Lysinibacillus sp. BW-2-10]TSI05081.1 UDP-3-O-(3-hydroxymyristoyl)glucosamine N-acyltransferase [Lysinibacillus sp. BW-2-10]